MTRFTLDDLAAIISARANASAAASYTKSLLDAGTARAAKKLGDAASYSWKTNVKVPEGGGGQFRPGPSEGKTEKDGYTYVKSTFGDNTMESIAFS